MSDPTFNPNQIGREGRTVVLDTDPEIPPAPRPVGPAEPFTAEPINADKPHNPLDGVKPEPPRTHPIAWGALALAALALILSVFALGQKGDGDDYRRVRVNNQECVIQMTGDTDVLFCATGPVPEGA